MTDAEEAVMNICSITGLDPVSDRQLVLNALRNNQNDPDRVVNDFFDDDAAFHRKYTHIWDESAFSTDRDGTANSAGISFSVEAPDDGVIQGVAQPPEGYYGPYGPPTAPSRPPSRSNNRSPLGRAIDLAAQNASVPSGTWPQEDEGRSRNEPWPSQGQEDGVIMNSDSSNPHFGPATRDEYPEGYGTMVQSSASNAGTTETEPPSARKRGAGVPAFLIHDDTRGNGYRLGPVLTILHEIPLARNVLLQSGGPARSYGINSEWWKGQPILSPEALQAISRGELLFTADTKPKFNEEIHRLMAFLDATERAYGSADVFGDIIPSPPICIERQFYDTLLEENGELKSKPLFTTAVVTDIDNDNPGEHSLFGIVEMDFSADQYDQIKTLYEAWDHMLWSDSLSWNQITEGCRMAMFEEMGEVIGVIIANQGPPDSIEIPPVWYPEKYMTDRKADARTIQEHWCWTKQKLYNSHQIEYDLTKWLDPRPGGKVIDKREMLQKLIDEYKGNVAFLEGHARFRIFEESGFDEEKYPDIDDIPVVKTDDEERLGQGCENVVRRCEFLLNQIEEKLKKLNEERELLRERQRFLGRVLTDPERPGRPRPMTGKQYHLRGVVSQHNIVYVCKRAESNLIELDDEVGPRDQWWRLSYRKELGNPVETTKTTLEEALAQVWKETRNPIVIYATDAAMEVEPLPLSPELQRFVKAENKCFQKELTQEIDSTATQAEASTSNAPEDFVNPADTTYVNTYASFLSPSKRKYREGSPDSMATNRASLGGGGSDVDSRAGDFADVFEPEDGGVPLETELTQFPDPPSHEVELDMFPQPPTREVPKIPLQMPPPASLSGTGRGPEMAEKSSAGSSPFLARPPGAEQRSPLDVDMSIPSDHEN